MGEAGKPKFAMYWAAGCGGCEIAVLNTGAKILDIDAAFDIAFWPVAVDAKYRDVEALDDGAITLTLLDGGMRSEENEAMARLLRRKSKLLVAFGSCACEACIPALANLGTASDVVETAFGTATTEDPGAVLPQTSWMAPEGELHLPALTPRVRTLDQVVPVDYYVPGCPPESHRIAEVIDAVLEAMRGGPPLPPPGAVLGAGHSTVCDECARRRDVKRIAAFHRIQEIEKLDPEVCLLEQGLVCGGPATRDGCGAPCPRAGAPCIGCYGPAEGFGDQGARLIAALGSVIEANDPDAIERVLDGIPDPAGQFYRFGMGRALVGRAGPGRQR